MARIFRFQPRRISSIDKLYCIRKFFTKNLYKIEIVFQIPLNSSPKIISYYFKCLFNIIIKQISTIKHYNICFSLNIECDLDLQEHIYCMMKSFIKSHLLRYIEKGLKFRYSFLNSSITPTFTSRMQNF